jgi:DNA-binding MarR family transcriptional regulator
VKIVPHPELNMCTESKLRRLLRCVSRHYDAELSPAGIKATQYELLSQLAVMDSPRPGQLAAALNLSAPTLSRNLRPLADVGWIELGPGEDGRSRRVALTQTGRIKQREASLLWGIAQKELMDRLGCERVRSLQAFISDALTGIHSFSGQDA